MKVLTFSRYFPAYHPNKLQETYFREKIWAGLADTLPAFKIPDHCTDWNWYEYYNARAKSHTIRAGNRWKVGDWFSPRVWSDKPYRSKQIEFAPPIQVKKIWELKIKDENVLVSGAMQDSFLLNEIARNDGLEYNDFMEWFQYPKPFSGQIICWNENINY